MTTLTPEAAISNSNFGLGGLVTMTPSNATNIPEQVLVTVHPMNDIGVSDEVSSALGNIGNAKFQGAAQLFGGNMHTLVNVPGMNAVPQLSTINIPVLASGAVNHLSPANMTALTTGPHKMSAHAAAPPAQSSSLSLQSIPQTILVPQLVLSGGQIVHSIQGSPMLLSSTGGPAQQIVTIPVNQVPSGQQYMQVLTSNGQILTTAVNNYQNLGGNQTVATSPGDLLPQTMLTNHIHGICQTSPMPQILTNAAGQILAVSPQLIGQSSGLLQVSAPISQIKAEKLSPQSTTSHMGISTNKTVISASGNNSLPATANVQYSMVNSGTQVVSQTTQRAVTPTQVIHVAQTSSPSVTSTESLGEIAPISQTTANTVDGINLEEIKEFAKAFKIRRLSLGLTQTQVGQALSITEGPAYSQSAICRFEKLDITPKSAQKIKPVLEQWMKEAEERYKNGAQNLTEFIGTEPTKKRKRRTSFTPQALEVLNHYFERNTHPSGAEMTEIADKLNYDREVVRVWFCNKRQTLKNTVKKLKVATQ